MGRQRRGRHSPWHASTTVAVALLLMIQVLQPVGVSADHGTYNFSAAVNVTQDAVDANLTDGLCDVDLATAGLQCTLRAAAQELRHLQQAVPQSADEPPLHAKITVNPGTHVLSIRGPHEDLSVTGDIDFNGQGWAISNLEIVGAGSNATTITSTAIAPSGPIPANPNAAATSDVAFNDRLLQFESYQWNNQQRLSVSGLTLQYGNGTGIDGGAVLAGNTWGGWRDVRVRNSWSESGGGLHLYRGAHTIEDSAVAGNVGPHAGGIRYQEGPLTLKRTSFTANAGHAVYMQFAGLLTVRDVSVTGTAPGPFGSAFAIGTDGILDADRLTISGNQAGNNVVFGAGPNASFVRNSTIVNNTGVAVVQLGGNSQIVNATITDNHASIAEAAIRANASAPTVMRDSIVANNTRYDNAQASCLGAEVVSGGHNIDAQNTCPLTGPGDQINTNPLLGPLEDNGGFVRTRAPAAGSPAIDAGHTGTPGTDGACASHDARGIARANDGDADGSQICDIGAFEGPLNFPLTVTKAGSGAGKVTSSDSTIDCGATCTNTYKGGLLVTLQATAAVGSTFVGWTGCTEAVAGETCQTRIGASPTVTATFDPQPPPPPPPPPVLASDSALSSPNSVLHIKSDPVDVVFGNFVHQQTDLRLPGIGPEVAVTRSYNSAVLADGPFGHGWSWPYSMRAEEGESGDVAVTYPDGRIDTFTAGCGGFCSPPDLSDTLTETAEELLLLTKSRTRYSFAKATGDLASIADSDGNAVTLQHGPDGVMTIVDASARSWDISWNAGHVASVEDPTGRTVTYAYADGDLVGATGPAGNTTTYAYDGDHRLTSIHDAEGHLVVGNTYGEYGRVVEQEDPRGTSSFSYAPGLSSFTDANSKTFLTFYDPETYLVTKNVDPAGNEVTYGYDSNGLLTSVTDPRGGVRSTTYDTRGNVITQTDPLGKTRTMTYDGDDLVSVTNERGKTTVHTYDAEHHLLSVTDPRGKTTSMTYNPNGSLASSTNPMGATTTYTYSPTGSVTKITDPLGKSTTYAYDGAGRRTLMTDARGRTTTASYDELDQLLEATTPDGGKTIRTYDKAGNVLSVTNPRGRKTTFTYNSANDLLAITSPTGATVQFTYDALGRPLTRKLPNGATWSMTYDDVGRPTSMTSPIGKTGKTEYDADGNVSKATDALNRSSTFTYDLAGRLTKVVDPAGRATTYAYDAAGNATAAKDPAGRTWMFAYDAANQPISRTDPGGRIWKVAYDAAGRVSATTDPLGKQIKYAYDAAGRVTGVTADGATTTYTYDAVGNRSSMKDRNGTTTYTVDAMNRVKAQSGPFGKLAYTYDLNGNRTQLVQPGATTTYSYDALDQLTSVKVNGKQAAGYTYDSVGRVKTRTLANAVTTTYGYRADGPLLSYVTKRGANVLENTSYTLNALGLRTKETATGFVGSYTFDVLQRLTSATVKVGTKSRAYAYTYDFNGNRTKTVAAGITTASTYDTANRLTKSGSKTVTHDLAGRLTSDGTRTYTYDAFGHVKTVGGATSASFRYDGDGNRVAETRAGKTTTYLVDTARLTPVRVAATTAGSSTRFFHGRELIGVAAPTGALSYYSSDALGSVRLATNASGGVVARYAYDPFGRPLSASGPFGFTGEPFVAGTNLLHLRARDYDVSLGRFLTPDPAGLDALTPQTINPYTYALNDPVNITDPSGLWPDWGGIAGAISSAFSGAANAAVGAVNAAGKAISNAANLVKEKAVAAVNATGNAIKMGAAAAASASQAVASGVQRGLAKLAQPATPSLAYSSQSKPIPGLPDGKLAAGQMFEFAGQTFQAGPGGAVIGVGAGNVIAVGGGNVIAVGGGNVIGVGAGNVIGVGAGNVIGVGAGNVIAVGGGNVVNVGAGNVIAVGGGNVIAVGSGNLATNNLAEGVARSGSSFQALSGLLKPSSVIAVGGGNVIAVGGGNVIAVGGGNVIATGSGH